MDKRLTWKEIKTMYPDTWVGLSDVEWDGCAPNVRSAIVKYSGESGDIQKRIIDGENIHMNCTMDDYMFPLGFQVGVK